MTCCESLLVSDKNKELQKKFKNRLASELFEQPTTKTYTT